MKWERVSAGHYRADCGSGNEYSVELVHPLDRDPRHPEPTWLCRFNNTAPFDSFSTKREAVLCCEADNEEQAKPLNKKFRPVAY